MVIQKVGSHAYKLDLPSSMKCHPVFHVPLLEPAASDPLEGPKRPPAPPVIVDDTEEYEVEEIVDSKVIRKSLKYLVGWVGYDELTWEPTELLKHSPLMLRHFQSNTPRNHGQITWYKDPEPGKPDTRQGHFPDQQESGLENHHCIRNGGWTQSLF